MPVSSFTSLNRDNLLRLATAPDFFVRNPALQQHEEAIKNCKDAYAKSKRSGCNCGGNTRLLIPCLEALLTTLEEMKTSNPAAVATFVQHVTGQKVGDRKIHVSIYYTQDNGSKAHRYEFIA